MKPFDNMAYICWSFHWPSLCRVSSKLDILLLLFTGLGKYVSVLFSKNINNSSILRGMYYYHILLFNHHHTSLRLCLDWDVTAHEPYAVDFYLYLHAIKYNLYSEFSVGTNSGNFVFGNLGGKENNKQWLRYSFEYMFRVLSQHLFLYFLLTKISHTTVFKELKRLYK